MFLWHEGRNFRANTGDCKLAAVINFIRGISPGNWTPFDSISFSKMFTRRGVTLKKFLPYRVLSLLNGWLFPKTLAVCSMYLSTDVGWTKPVYHQERMISFSLVILWLSIYLTYFSSQGFPGDKVRNSLWTTKCSVFLAKGGVIYNKCDATRGSSGSGVFVTDRSGTKVVGVLSAETKRSRLNVAVHFTRSKVNQINGWTRK